MPRRERSDSVSAAIKTHQAVGKFNGFEWGRSGIQPLPDQEGRENAQRFADQIYLARAEEHWQEHDRVLIAQLANYWAEIERLEAELRDADYVIVKEGKNGPIATRHPLLDVVGYLAQRASRIVAQLSINTKTTAEVTRNSANLQRSALNSGTRTLANGQKVNASSLLA